jgi:hypothetical protein
MKRETEKMTLTVELTPEEEALISAEAEAEGLPVAIFVRDILKKIVRHDLETRRAALPIWPGRVIGDLRREDIYADVG